MLRAQATRPRLLQSTHFFFPSGISLHKLHNWERLWETDVPLNLPLKTSGSEIESWLGIRGVPVWITALPPVLWVSSSFLIYKPGECPLQEGGHCHCSVVGGRWWWGSSGGCSSTLDLPASFSTDAPLTGIWTLTGS